MDKKKKSAIVIMLSALPMASAIIWGAVIIGCSAKLKVTGGYDEIQNLLVAGVTMHIIIIGGVIANVIGQLGNKKEEENKKQRFI